MRVFASRSDVETESPTFAQAQSQLTSSLEHRPAKDELVAANIIKDTALAPSLQGTAAELEKAVIKQAIERRTSRRPSATELVHQHILQADAQVAPALHSAMRELEKATITDTLSKAIHKRPEREALVDSNGVAPALMGAALELEKAKTQDALRKGLARRPSAAQLEDANILRDTSLAPALQSIAADLEKAQVTDSLRQGILRRPSLETVASIVKGKRSPTEQSE
ncbi:hypothetical protein HK105_204869 [Polyrhizophydium stewartii]|uniref:Uncharacterized protein n=1 Tax=Polyrhizophydium stewartii TaxID=2732419 RepID=A0ABR4N846_9FUNG